MFSLLREAPRNLSRRLPHLRTISTTVRHAAPPSPFGSAPSPPRLPKEEQEIFERLQRESTGAFSTPLPQREAAGASSSSATPSPSGLRVNQVNQVSQNNQSPDSSPTAKLPASTTTAPGENEVEVEVGKGEEEDGDDSLHPHIRRGAPPEFDGERNPKTGEVGGPKNEPLRWGARGDWSFNGRVTDF